MQDIKNQSLTEKYWHQSDVPCIQTMETTDPVAGRVVWAPAKSLWFSALAMVALIGVPLTFSLEHLLVFAVTSAFTLCLGHSLGMHRLLIHRAFKCPKWLDYLLVHLGTIVGIAGPRGMLQAHDSRDWAQRQPTCHDFYSHGQPMAIDGFWQIHCDVVLDNPPRFQPDAEFENDRGYRFMEKTWMAQQIPLALILFAFGGLGWVIWGTALRVVVSVTGHWLIGYFAHNDGKREWHVENAGVQGYNIGAAALFTFGECWHNNHHAWPGSAKFGLQPGQIDPGWWVLKTLEWFGLVWDLRLPADLDDRPELVHLQSADPLYGGSRLLAPLWMSKRKTRRRDTRAVDGANLATHRQE